ncbi:MAG: AAA family ATPase [Spirochaetales bacterium]|nr:AAA family ATPase [Spirochaetales bacterium]
MRLMSVQLSDYKCIRETCGFDVSDITCLVGKNESGKTAILEALYRLNPVVPQHGNFNVDDDFPRIDVEDYRLDVAQGGREPAIVTRAVFSLEKGDLLEIEADFPGVIAHPELMLSKGYANELFAELTVNEEIVVEGLLKKARLGPQVLKSLVRCATVHELAEALKAHSKEEAAGKLLESIGAILEKGLLQYLYETYIEPKVPKFLYFDEFYQMKGHVNIQALIERRQKGELLDSDYPLLGLIDLARLNLEEISNPRRALERDNRLEGASNHLTRSLMKYWSQNKDLELRFDIRPGLLEDPEGMQSGTNLWGHVYNSKQKVSTLLGRRSRGFVWFFSFLAWFSQQKRKKIPLILLLDEPSLFLHGSAQADLLRFLEDECAEGLQVIYSTQSPYMVDSRHMERVRIVEDRSTEAEQLSATSREGTQVFTDPSQTAKESILALEGALAYSLSQNLFPHPCRLLVEGAHDLLYLRTVSALLVRSGGKGLDPRWTIIPMGGSMNAALFATLAGDHASQKQAYLLGRRTDLAGRLPNQNRVFAYETFAADGAAGIEDLFEEDFYLELVNRSYADALSRPLSRKHLGGPGLGIARKVSAVIQSAFQDGSVRFDRLAPAAHFAAHGEELQGALSPESRQRFERLFAALNAILG